ncbi:hypothetical protein HER10_EVM0007094 [Colletotrichum scovillei]|uniref:uncharacterized protein n=1 Tax=Colletotrichum scovillei TaxID=1209932 RepID=UPI0015C32CB6|nr:uncharacterized protein HER10_EVM0007094 [Colletotrichum scovillei]KAF4776561.1 hypothetical protein HER10_EVM0007094 [Colletotrichum scovillei]
MSDNKQGGKWSNPAFLLSLVVGFYDELKNGSLPQEAKDRVEAKLHRDGFEDTTWDNMILIPFSTHYTPILSAPISFPDTTLFFFHIPSIVSHQPTQYYTNTITMSEKSAPGGKWANPALLEALAMGFHTVAKGEGLTKEAKDAVILKMHAYGFTDITWEAVRCIDQQILVSMVKTMAPSTDQYSVIIDELHALGHTMTVSALKCAFHLFPSSFPTSASPAASFPPLPTYFPRSSDLSVFPFFHSHLHSNHHHSPIS